MAAHQLKKLALALAVQMAAGIPTVALANQIDEVVVTATPIRDSDMAAIEAKRNADNYVDIISADTRTWPIPSGACPASPLSATRARRATSTCAARHSATPASPLTASTCPVPKAAASRALTASPR